MTEKLKPCPFCGKNEALVYEHRGSCGVYHHQIVCSISLGGCGASGSMGHTKEQAIDAWNKRSAGMKDLLTGEDTGLTPEDLLKLVQEQLARLLSQNSQITQQSQLLYQEIRNCQGLIEQLRTY